MKRTILCAVFGVACVTAAQAQGSASFYKGRTINVICGFAAGGGYDAYARLISRHMGRHVPGAPQMIVQNMTGAGSVRAANYVYVNAPKDGTVIAAVNQNMPMYQLLGGAAAHFDAAKFNWLGSIVSSNGILTTWHTSATKTLKDAFQRETIMGGSGTNSDSHIFPTLLNNLLGTKFKVINGYSGGSADINLALERGEVEGRGGNSWASLISGNPDWIKERKLNYIIQFGLVPEPAIPGVPLLQDVVASAEDKEIAFLIGLPIAIGYAYWLAPEVPKDRMADLRAAWSLMLKDAAFMEEARKAGLQIKPQDASELEEVVRKAVNLSPQTLNRAATLLEWKR
jgi:tripartite-type tricarboxylate transporter receptor subunit TctC